MISNNLHITLSTHETTWFCCELNVLPREHITRSHLNLHRVGLRSQISSMQRKYHQQHAKMSSTVIHKFTHIWLSILYTTNHTCDRWNENFINGFSRFLESIYFKYIKSLQSKLEFEPKSYHIFHIFSYVPSFIYFLLVCGNYSFTLKRGRCRNLL